MIAFSGLQFVWNALFNQVSVQYRDTSNNELIPTNLCVTFEGTAKSSNNPFAKGAIAKLRYCKPAGDRTQTVEPKQFAPGCFANAAGAVERYAKLQPNNTKLWLAPYGGGVTRGGYSIMRLWDETRDKAQDFLDFGGSKCKAGAGQFASKIPKKQKIAVGYVPAGKSNVYITVETNQDVDLFLVDIRTNYKIIDHQGGLIKSSGPAKATWNKAIYSYSVSSFPCMQSLPDLRWPVASSPCPCPCLCLCSCTRCVQMLTAAASLFHEHSARATCGPACGLPQIPGFVSFVLSA